MLREKQCWFFSTWGNSRSLSVSKTTYLPFLFLFFLLHCQVPLLYCTKLWTKDKENRCCTKLADIKNFTRFSVLSLNTGMKFIHSYKMKNPVRESFMAAVYHRHGSTCDSFSFTVKLLVERGNLSDSPLLIQSWPIQEAEPSDHSSQKEWKSLCDIVFLAGRAFCGACLESIYVISVLEKSVVCDFLLFLKMINKTLFTFIHTQLVQTTKTK